MVMRNFVRAVAAMASLAACAAPAMAHPGDHAGGVGETLLHMLSNADHLLLLLAAVAAGVGLACGMKAMRRPR